LIICRANSALGASSSTAVRSVRSAAECGAMKSVERVEWAMFSSAAWMRSLS
jgi:hypothetical protein